MRKGENGRFLQQFFFRSEINQMESRSCWLEIFFINGFYIQWNVLSTESIQLHDLREKNRLLFGNYRDFRLLIIYKKVNYPPAFD